MNDEVAKRIEAYLAKRMYELKQLRLIYDACDANDPHRQVEVMQQIHKLMIQIGTIDRLYLHLREEL